MLSKRLVEVARMRRLFGTAVLAVSLAFLPSPKRAFGAEREMAPTSLPAEDGGARKSLVTAISRSTGVLSTDKSSALDEFAVTIKLWPPSGEKSPIAVLDVVRSHDKVAMVCRAGPKELPYLFVADGLTVRFDESGTGHLIYMFGSAPKLMYGFDKSSGKVVIDYEVFLDGRRADIVVDMKSVIESALEKAQTMSATGRVVTIRTAHAKGEAEIVPAESSISAIGVSRFSMLADNGGGVVVRINPPADEMRWLSFGLETFRRATTQLTPADDEEKAKVNLSVPADFPRSPAEQEAAEALSKTLFGANAGRPEGK
jgi:hypothetical protein